MNNKFNSLVKSALLSCIILLFCKIQIEKKIFYKNITLTLIVLEMKYVTINTIIIIAIM